MDAGASGERELRTIRWLVEITSSANLQRSWINCIPDFNKVAELGVTVQSLADVICVATYSDFSNVMPKLN